jgi:hypothetical protein
MATQKHDGGSRCHEQGVCHFEEGLQGCIGLHQLRSQLRAVQGMSQAAAAKSVDSLSCTAARNCRVAGFTAAVAFS